MELVKVALSELREYENNPRENKKGIEHVAASIKQCGYVAPIIVDENYVILAGHTRYKALVSLGKQEAEVLIKEGLTADQKKKFRILDNRVSELSVWDYDKLYEELEGMDFDNFGFGFEKLMEAIDQNLDTGYEFDMEDFADENFEHECPECGFRF